MFLYLVLLNNGACDNYHAEVGTLQVRSETLGLVQPFMQIMSIAPPNTTQDSSQMLTNAQQLSAISELNCPIHLSVLRHSIQLAPMRQTCGALCLIEWIHLRGVCCP